MKKLILIICLLPFLGLSQKGLDDHYDIIEQDSSSIQTKINSLHSILNREKTKLHDTIVVSFYLQLAELYSENKDALSAIEFCDTLIENYKELDFYLLKEIEEQRAMYHKDAGNSEEAIAGLLKILSEYEDRKDFGESAKLNKRIGVIFLKMKSLEDAEYHLRESVQHARKVGDTETEGYSLMSLGNRFKKENKFKEAEENYKKSIVIAKRDDYKRLLAGNYNNYGSLYRMMKKPNQAMDYYKLAVKINKEIGNDKWLSYNYNNLGNLYKEKKQYQEALNYFLLSVKMKVKIDDYRGKVQSLSNIADTYFLMGQLHKAYSYQKSYSKLQDSISALDNVNATKSLAAEFQAEKREADIRQLNMEEELLRKDNKAQKERITYQNSIGWVLGVGIFLIFGVALMLWKSVVNRKKINSELVSKNQQIDEQHNEIIDSINYAKRIQNSILPGTERLKKLLINYSILYKPKDIISGDFYVCDETDNGIYFGTVDCTGHGVPGAMVSLVGSAHFNKMLHELHLNDPGDILNQLNKEVPDALALENEVINDGMDMALCCLSKDRTKLRFSGAYQNCWILNEKTKNDNRNITGNYSVYEGDKYSIIELKAERQGIGKTTNKIDFTTQTIELQKDDKILLSTDGYQDQFGGPNNKKFKVKEMRKLILEKGGDSPKQLIDTLSSVISSWQGDFDQIDDICIMIVEID